MLLAYHPNVTRICIKYLVEWVSSTRDNGPGERMHGRTDEQMHATPTTIPHLGYIELRGKTIALY